MSLLIRHSREKESWTDTGTLLSQTAQADSETWREHSAPLSRLAVLSYHHTWTLQITVVSVIAFSLALSYISLTHSSLPKRDCSVSLTSAHAFFSNLFSGKVAHTALYPLMAVDQESE